MNVRKLKVFSALKTLCSCGQKTALIRVETKNQRNLRLKQSSFVNLKLFYVVLSVHQQNCFLIKFGT